MLRTRLWMGAVLIALAVGVLVIDRWLAPWYPFLFVFVLALALLACFELVHLLRAGLSGADVKSRDGAANLAGACPPVWLACAGVAAVIVANWPAHLIGGGTLGNAWLWVAGTFAGVVLLVFLVEMATFREPGVSVVRIALGVWVVAYLGLLSCFVAQLRWLPEEERAYRGSAALALTFFVPKFADSGAYFTGRLLGKHRMTPVLSPKKTWEGAAGALVAGAATAVAIQATFPVFRGGQWAAVGFGLTLAVVGLLGDLAESLIKRDCRQKDASQVVPGFGGVLDVVDSVIFSAPVAYAWLVW